MTSQHLINEFKKEFLTDDFKHEKMFAAVGFEVTTKSIKDFILKAFEAGAAAERENCNKLLKLLEERAIYNQHDFGEAGKFVRIEYLHNFIQAILLTNQA